MKPVSFYRRAKSKYDLYEYHSEKKKHVTLYCDTQVSVL